jgi:hypothetical protein
MSRTWPLMRTVIDPCASEFKANTLDESRTQIFLLLGGKLQAVRLSSSSRRVDIQVAIGGMARTSGQFMLHMLTKITRNFWGEKQRG